MGIIGCWFQWTLKQLEREQTDRQRDTQTDTQTDTQDNYRNPRACTPRVNQATKHIESDSDYTSGLNWNNVKNAVSECTQAQMHVRVMQTAESPGPTERHSYLATRPFSRVISTYTYFTKGLGTRLVYPPPQCR